MVQLHETVRAALIEHAREEAPNECCGLLIGRGTSIDDSVRGRNVHETPRTRYMLDPRTHIETNRRLRGTARTVVGSYHSHPESPPFPSETDIAEAAYLDFIWLIVSLAGDAKGEIAAYRMAGGAERMQIVLVR